jgi:hypothetical protein
VRTNTEHWFAGLESAFRTFGGVPETVLTDTRMAETKIAQAEAQALADVRAAAADAAVAAAEKILTQSVKGSAPRPPQQGYRRAQVQAELTHKSLVARIERQRNPGSDVPQLQLTPDIASLYPGYDLLALSWNRRALHVMAGPVPAIHVFLPQPTNKARRGCPRQARA